MRILILALLGIISGLFGNIVATWIDGQWGLSTPGRIGITLIIFSVVVISLILLEVGIRIPGHLAFHRFWYLYALTHTEVLARWKTRFATLHLGRGPRYVDSVEVLDQGERRDLVELLYHAVTRRHSDNRHILILGEPGCGKSTALERLALKLASYSLGRMGLIGPIPVLIQGRDLMETPTIEAILGSALKRWTRGSTRKILTKPESVRRLADSPRLVFLFDALDEITGPRRDKVLNILASLSSTAGSAHVSSIVSCRTRQDPEHALPNYQTYSILDLSDDAVMAFIRIYGIDP